MIGIICALKIEVEGIQKLMSSPGKVTYARMDFIKGIISGRDVVAVECGIGKVNAAICAQAMIDLFRPDVIINSGISGALNDKISIGDVVIARDVVQHDMDGTAMGDPPGEIWFNDEKKISIETDKKVSNCLFKACSTLKKTKTIFGRIATGDTFVEAKEKRLEIGEKFGADSCEMEGGAVGQVCYRNGVPFGILRCISDDINQNDFMDFNKFKNLASEKSIKAMTFFIREYHTNPQ